MERQIPKNVRQIGNVSDSPKIYVEDYVDTFFLQLCDKAKDGPIGAFLVGDMQKSEDEEYVYIYGAIQMHDLKLVGNEYVIDDETWKNAYEDCKQYFEDGEMLGWFVAQPGVELDAKSNIVKLHKKSFPKQNTVFVMKDSAEKEESYFVHKLNDLMEIGGRYTYYEKNPCMQNYMISSRKENKITPSESITDRAAKDFRSIVKAKLEKADQKQNNRFLYAASTFLLIVILIIGVTMVNNYDKIKAVQTSIDQITKTVEKAENEKEAQAAEGKVTTQVEETTEEETGKTDTAGTTQTPDTDSNGEYYVVQRGDTLATISQKLYGDTSHIDAIARMNGLTNGDFIYIGQKLLLP